MKLNDYIIAHADKEAGESDFLQRFGQEDVFFSIEVPHAQLKDGPLQASPDAEIGLQMAKLDMGLVALFYASKHDSRLTKRFAGMPLMRAIQMVCSIPQVDGLLIQSDANAWLMVRKEVLRRIVGLT